MKLRALTHLLLVIMDGGDARQQQLLPCAVESGAHSLGQVSYQQQHARRQVAIAVPQASLHQVQIRLHQLSGTNGGARAL